MGRRTVLPPSAFAGPGMARRLRDLQLDQAAARPRQQPHLLHGWDIGEVNRLRKIVRGIFGDAGVIESTADNPGELMCGRFLDPPDGKTPGDQRRRIFPFRGRNLAEIEKQIREWRARS